FFFSSRRRHTRFSRDWSSDVCSSDLKRVAHEGHDLLKDRLPRLGLTEEPDDSRDCRLDDDRDGEDGARDAAQHCTDTTSGGNSATDRANNGSDPRVQGARSEARENRDDVVANEVPQRQQRPLPQLNRRFTHREQEPHERVIFLDAEYPAREVALHENVPDAAERLAERGDLPRHLFEDRSSRIRQIVEQVGYLVQHRTDQRINILEQRRAETPHRRAHVLERALSRVASLKRRPADTLLHRLSENVERDLPLRPKLLSLGSGDA